MREIKFRAWDTEYKRWESPDGIGLSDGVAFSATGDAYVDDVYTHYPDYAVQQYTGLKDKNGVEIYEGDIVKYRAKKVEHDAVFYEGSSFKLCQQSRRTTRTLDHHMDKWQVTVIGNIYENPELLEANQ